MKESLTNSFSKVGSNITIIKPPSQHISLGLKEILEYKDLIWILVWREIKIRYKQTIVGSMWAVIQPVITMVVFTLLFSNILNVPSDDVPYPIFSYCALVPWTYFTHALNKTTHSVTLNSSLITKVFFPRLILPLTAVLGAFVDFTIAFIILLLMMLFYGIVPTINVVFLPFFILLTVITALSIGLWLAAINVKYRDINNALPFLIQVGLFITPVAYSSKMIPEKWAWLYALNPMAGVVEGFRWSLLGKGNPPQLILLISSFALIILLIGGLYFFRRKEESFADVI